MREGRTYWAAIALLAAIGAALRGWHIGSEPLWLDEAYSAYAAGHGFAFLWRVVPGYETHPPFYYSLLHLWVEAFGDGLIALRLPGLLAGLATPPVVALAAREAGIALGWDGQRRARLTLAAFGLACLSTAMVEMARQVRPYPIMILVYAAALAVLLRLGRARGAGRPLAGRAFAVYLILLEAILWLHNLGPLYALALTVALAIALSPPPRRDLPWLIGGHVLVGLLYLPGLAILHDQTPTWVASTWLRFTLDGGFVDHVATLYAAPGWPALAALVLVLLALAALRRSAPGVRLGAMLLVLALLPVLLAVAVSLAVSPIFITRTMTPVAAPAILLLAIGAAAGAGKGRLIGPGGALIVGAAMLGGDIQLRMAGPMQDWYRTVAWLASRFRPGDQVFAYPNEGALPLHYALRDRGLDYPIRPIPTAVPSFAVAGGRYPTGSRGVVSLPRAQLRAIAAQPATRDVQTIWLLRLGASTYDPGDMFLQELHRGRYIVRSWQSGPIDIVGLKRLPGKPVQAPSR